MSTFGGIINEIPNVSVDRFDGVNLKSTVFLLSHCHSDHTEGLYHDDFVNRLQSASIYLYCSEITFNILLRTRLRDYKECIKILSFHVDSIINVPGSPDFPHEQNITVTAIPAGHCPGSLMFLLETKHGRILYTGDIRIAEGDVTKFKQLLDSDGNIKSIQSLYLDTTFYSPHYNYFPRRKESAHVVCELIQEWLQIQPHHYVYLRLPAKYGSEYLFSQIYRNLRIKVHVNIDNFYLYANIPEVRDAVTASPYDTRIHACYENKNPCRFLSSRDESHIRQIKPSAMWFKSAHRDDKKIQRKQCELFRVAYSSHSSYTELNSFISHIKPENIIPCAIPPFCEKKHVLQYLKENKFTSTKCKFKASEITSEVLNENKLEFKNILTTYQRNEPENESKEFFDDLSSP